MTRPKLALLTGFAIGVAAGLTPMLITANLLGRLRTDLEIVIEEPLTIRTSR